MVADINMTVFAPHSFEVTDVRPIGSASLVLSRPRQPGTSGFRNTIGFGNGLFATWASVERAQPIEETYSSNGSIKINLRIEGQSTVSGETHGPQEITRMMCSALIQPKGRTKFESFEKDSHEESITISSTRDFLTEELGLVADDFSGELAKFLEGKPYEFTLLRTNFTVELKQAAVAFFEPAGDPFSYRLMLQARACDIVRLFFEGLRTQTGDNARYKSRDLKLVTDLRRILSENLESPPSTNELAKMTATSPSRMMRVFKAIEGRTISEYLTAQRMTRSLEMMREGELSITQIAFEVGYEHSANFSTAFRRHYGMTPREAMRGTGLRLPEH